MNSNLLEKKETFKMSVSNRAKVKISVGGIGGAGGNTIFRLVDELSDINNVKLIAINTDIQALSLHGDNDRITKIQIGKELTNGRGAGDDPEIGEKAALENIDDIVEAFVESDLIFLTAGLGKGTGTGATPVIAEKLRNSDDEFSEEPVLVTVVTTPFGYEGKKKERMAKETIKKLKNVSDAVIVISNKKLMQNYKDLSVTEALKKSDELLAGAIKGLIMIINNAGTMNVDFNDVKTVLKQSGNAIMGIGVAEGENRAEKALSDAINNKLLEENISLKNAKKSIVFIKGSRIIMSEVEEIGEKLSQELDEDATIITGIYEDGRQNNGKLEVVVYIGGFKNSESEQGKIQKSNFDKYEIPGYERNRSDLKLN